MLTSLSGEDKCSSLLLDELKFLAHSAQAVIWMSGFVHIFGAVTILYVEAHGLHLFQVNLFLTVIIFCKTKDNQNHT